ncbi:MAG: cob(I)yrinic acid a,c-diamide adenosyltransferase [Candidatus Fermentibacteraceae bacterium]|nr:cob(I)yrinic acid a,c-diamide adenosyltransferase [Candidatus Fermentibacteraceae bacterium]MBN2608460.1 cob(I)yrinic acid a,c-diamide adenosyltransferase [Candidatus Fermentibacteraceae bacterium]
MKGRLQLYTGNGKGKTTAAIGLAVRAACSGMRVYIGQFMKGTVYSELELPDHFPGLITIEQFGSPRLLCRGEKPDIDDIDRARRGLMSIRRAMSSGEYGMVVADELSVTVHLGLLGEADVMELIGERPEELELVITGRCAPDSFVRAADLVTEMREVKHYYATEGLQARKGIEF